MLKRTKILFIVPWLIFGWGQGARADLALIGPVDPVTGFPAFVQDANNVQIGPCDRIEEDPLEPGVNAAPCPGTELDVLADPPGFVQGNIAEFTYYRTEANIVNPTPGVKRFRLRIEVQGGVIPPESINNAVRLVMTFNPGAQQGIYTIFSPFGVEEVVVGPGEIASKLDTELAGGVLAQVPNFDPARGGNVMCFWDHTFPIDPILVDGQQFISDGVFEGALAPVPGNPNCPQTAANGIADGGDLEFHVLYPDNTTLVGTDQFSVEGKLVDQAGIVVDRANYLRFGTLASPVAAVNLWVSSVAGATILVTPGTAQLAAGPQAMAEDVNDPGHYYLRQLLVPSTLALPPDAVNNPVTLTVNGQAVQLVDELRIVQANQDITADTIAIVASSSDFLAQQTGNLVLTATDENGSPIPLSGPVVPVPPDIPIREVTVNSAAGGVDTEQTFVLGGAVFAPPAGMGAAVETDSLFDN